LFGISESFLALRCVSSENDHVFTCCCCSSLEMLNKVHYFIYPKQGLKANALRHVISQTAGYADGSGGLYDPSMHQPPELHP
ncbi:hypothetical protein TNCT_127031, partial [Trichonephila clavata]